MNNSSFFLEQLLVSTTHVIGSDEYGASKLALLMMRRLKLDRMISPYKSKWVEEVLVLIVKKLISTSTERMVDCKDSFGDLPYQSLVKLISKKEYTEKKLARKLVKGGTSFFLDLISGDTVLGADEIQLGLLINQEGFPFGIVTFLTRESSFSDHIERIRENYGLRSLVLVSNLEEVGGKIADCTVPLAISQAYYRAKRVFKDIFIEKNSCNSVPLSAFLLIGLLTSYLKLYMIKKLDDYVIATGKSEFWTLREVFEKLKTIRSQSIQVGSAKVDEVKNELDAEQTEIIFAFGLTPTQFFMS